MTEKKDNHHSRDDILALREALEVYVSGRSGLRFEALARFAGPLFDLYEVNWKSADRAADDRDGVELSTMLAVLDTARLLWSFFLLDSEKSLQCLPELEDALLGRGAGNEERSNVLVLLSLMEGHWHQFTSEERMEAEQTPGFTLPPFESLLGQYRERTPRQPARGDRYYGPHDLDLPEALALFAQPLLDDARIQNDPDAIERQIARAQAYWELATAPPQDYEAELARILEAFAQTTGEKELVRREADAMVERYHRLFPERPGRQV